MQRMQQKQKEAVEGLGMEGAVPSVPSVASVLPNEKPWKKRGLLVRCLGVETLETTNSNHLRGH